MRIPFGRIWAVRQYELKHWIFYNIIIALSPVLLSWIFLTFGGVYSHFATPFLDGTLLVFAATLSGASMSFFVTETKLSLRQTERFIFNGLLGAIFLGAGGYTAIAMLKQFSPASLWSPMVFLTSCVVVMLAAYFNMYLAGVRSVYPDTDLMETLIEEEVQKPKAALTQKAHAAKEVDGAKL